MNAIEKFDWLPSADHFLGEMVRRIDDGYARAIVPLSRAVAAAGGDSDRLIQFSGSPKAKAAFLLGCAAEEVASIGSRLNGKREKDYLRAVVEQLKARARPIASRRISPDFRKLVKLFREEPSRMRVQVVYYMLDNHGLTTIAEQIAADQVCQLAIECTAMNDGISGTLLDLIEAVAYPITGRRPMPSRFGGSLRGTASTQQRR